MLRILRVVTKDDFKNRNKLFSGFIMVFKSENLCRIICNNTYRDGIEEGKLACALFVTADKVSDENGGNRPLNYIQTTYKSYTR